MSDSHTLQVTPTMCEIESKDTCDELVNSLIELVQSFHIKMNRLESKMDKMMDILEKLDDTSH
jgi:hypothetical protein